MTDTAQGRPERRGSESQRREPGASSDGLLAVAANLSRYHREHEKYYAEAPLTDAIALQRAARTLLSYPQLADLLAERHKIIGNNWQNAFTAQLIARYLRRAVSIMEQVDFTSAGLRRDLASARTAPAYLYSAAELINHAAPAAAGAAPSVPSCMTAQTGG